MTFLSSVFINLFRNSVEIKNTKIYGSLYELILNCNKDLSIEEFNHLKLKGDVKLYLLLNKESIIKKIINEWEILQGDSEGYYIDNSHCNLCNSFISHKVLIKNKLNNSTLSICKNCIDELFGIEKNVNLPQIKKNNNSLRYYIYRFTNKAYKLRLLYTRMISTNGRTSKKKRILIGISLFLFIFLIFRPRLPLRIPYTYITLEGNKVQYIKVQADAVLAEGMAETIILEDVSLLDFAAPYKIYKNNELIYSCSENNIVSLNDAKKLYITNNKNESIEYEFYAQKNNMQFEYQNKVYVYDNKSLSGNVFIGEIKPHNIDNCDWKIEVPNGVKIYSDGLKEIIEDDSVTIYTNNKMGVGGVHCGKIVFQNANKNNYKDNWKLYNVRQCKINANSTLNYIDGKNGRIIPTGNLDVNIKTPYSNYAISDEESFTINLQRVYKSEYDCDYSVYMKGYVTEVFLGDDDLFDPIIELREKLNELLASAFVSICLEHLLDCLLNLNRSIYI